MNVQDQIAVVLELFAKINPDHMNVCVRMELFLILIQQLDVLPLSHVKRKVIALVMLFVMRKIDVYVRSQISAMIVDIHVKR
jgi:hypothetical protein